MQFIPLYHVLYLKQYIIASCQSVPLMCSLPIYFKIGNFFLFFVIYISLSNQNQRIKLVKIKGGRLSQMTHM